MADRDGGVLIVTAPGVPGIRPVVDALAAPPAHASGARRLAVPVQVKARAPGQTDAQLAREIKPSLGGYQAVYATSMSLARAVQREDAHIPIVFKGEADPVAMCLTDSMQRPGRNATGYMDYLPDDDAKMMEVLVYGFPNLRTIYIMVSGGNFYVPDCGPLAREPKPARQPCVAGLRKPDSYLEWMQLTPPVLAQAARLGVDVKFMILCERDDFARLASIEPGRSDVGFVFSLQALYWRHAEELVAQVARARRPAIYGQAMFAKIGGLMSLEPIRDAEDDRTAINMLWQVIDGRAPATLPVQMPRGFKLTLNATAAAAQGLKPSLKVLRRADDVLAGVAR
jgi:putative tryptophan/tyrosine transport system substrate-binding protein